jgi:UDP-N-acetylglucosamine:LPS N-acetylglucosamine transferase
MDEDSVTTPAQPTAEFGGFGGGGGGGVDRCASLLEAIKKMGLRAISNLPEDDSCLRQLYNQYGVNTKFALANAVSRTGGT